jgi:hypothetical protein
VVNLAVWNLAVRNLAVRNLTVCSLAAAGLADTVDLVGEDFEAVLALIRDFFVIAIVASPRSC